MSISKKVNKLASMQPYFFPYLGYFQLIHASDLFIIFDTPQYIRHGWIERNKILKPDGEALYIKVPLNKKSSSIKIDQLTINHQKNWKKKIFDQIVPYRKFAPNYWQVCHLLKEALDTNTDSLVELNKITMKVICDYLEIKTPIKVFSKMNLDIEPVNAPDEWALNISKSLGAKTYINPTGGMSFYDHKKYIHNNINLRFLNPELKPYKQLENNFVPGLSIIDVLMFNDKDAVKKMLDHYKLVKNY